jgi:hypothetical protein
MPAELKKCLTMIFRHKGKELLGEHEFVYAASMDMHWFPPKEAQKLLDIAIREGLLKLSQGMLSPTFELVDENLDIAYHPSADLLKSHTKPEKKDLFSEITGRIMSEAKLPKKEAVSKINKTRERMDIEVEVAALLVARSYGLDISEEIVACEQRILTKSG